MNNSCTFFLWLHESTDFRERQSVYSTEQYLRLTSDLYPELLRMGDIASGLIKDIINHAINIEEDE